MHIRLTLAALAMLAHFIVPAQTSMNMVMQSNWDDNTLPSRTDGQVYNDIWGYTAPNGTEVAILGSLEKVHFIDVTDPISPTVIDEFTVYNVTNSNNVVNSVWRDFKTYDHYAYAVADQENGGLQIFDLQYVPDSVVLVYQDDEFFPRVHNIWIDTLGGRLYATGFSGSTTDVIILDISTDPENPSLLAEIDDLPGGYIHDIHVINHLAYASSGFDGLYIFDFTDPGMYETIAIIDGYPEEGYNHSSWLADDGFTLVFCDETHGKSVKLVDVTDPLDLGPSDFKLFKSQLIPDNSNSIAHNPFILDDFAYIAYYHDGVQIFDISDPENIVKVGYYDTYPDNTNYSGYDGAWGVYPYLASGQILASDTENGLFVLMYEPAPLPLDFVSFQVKHLPEQRVRLQWQVEQPRSGDLYDVFAGTDANHMEKIGTVEGVRYQTAYTFSHKPGINGTYYYQVLATEIDGREVLSPICSINISNAADFRVYPTYTRGTVTIEGVQNLQSIALYNLQSHLLQYLELDLAGSKFHLDLSNYPTGMYMLELEASGRKYTERLVRY